MVVLAVAFGSPASAQLPDHPAISNSPKPKWVIQQKLPKLGENTEQSEARYLLVDQQIRLSEQGEQQVYRRFTYRLETRSALEGWSSWQIEFAPSFERLIVHQVRVERDGSWQDRLQRSRASLLHREDELDQQIYDDRRNLLLVFDDIRVGDTVDISYSVLGTNPLFAGRFFFASWLGWASPVGRCHLRVLYPSSRQIAVKAHAGATEPVRRDRRGVSEILWALDGLEAVRVTNDLPASTFAFPFVELSEYQSWQEVVQWALPLYEIYSSPKLDALALELTANADDPWQRLVKARNWVQDEVRYFAALIGNHSHAPHATADILARRYGDCKDKAILLVHLLRRLEIEAWPALVHSEAGRGLDTRLPSPSVFDHAIVMAEIEGQKIWIDATLSLQGGERHLFTPDYGFGLPIKPNTTALATIEIAPEAVPTTDVLYVYEFEDTDQPIQVEIMTQYLGGEAESMRRTVDSTSPADLLQSYLDFYTGDGFTPEASSDLKIEDDRTANALSVIEQYSLRYADPDGEIDFSILPLLLEQDLGLPGESPGEIIRQEPFALRFPFRRSEIVILRTPEAASYSEVAGEEDNPWFRFSVESQKSAAELKLHYQLETKTSEVAAADLPEYSKAIERMYQDLGYGVWASGVRGDLKQLPYALVSNGMALFALVAYALSVGAYLRRHGLWGHGG